MQATSGAPSQLWRAAISLIASAALIVVVAWVVLALIGGTFLPGAVDRGPEAISYADYGIRHAPTAAPYEDYGIRHAPILMVEDYQDYGIRHAP
jgi:hypothetical protein